MEASTKQSELSVKIELPPPESSKCGSSDEERLKCILGLAAVFGQSLSAGVTDLYLQALSDLTGNQFQTAVDRALKECKFFPRPSELREFATANADAEMRAAWDTLQRFVSRHVSSSPYGSYYVEGGNETLNLLDQRIADAARRSGGWAAYKQMTPKEFPFLQKRFFEEYSAWSEVQRVFDIHPMLAAPERKLRLEMAEPPKSAPAIETPMRVEPPKFVIKPIPEPLTEAQMRDRREMLQQQVAHVLKRGAL